MGLIAKIKEMNYKKAVNNFREYILIINDLIPVDLSPSVTNPLLFYNNYKKHETIILSITNGDNIAKMKANTLRVNLLDAAGNSTINTTVIIQMTDNKYDHDVRLDIMVDYSIGLV